MQTFDATRHLRDRFWHPVCHRSELPAEGDYLRFEWLGEDLVVHHDGGRILAFDNLCRHRGARIFGGDVGNAVATCPYHGWTYRAGRLAGGAPEPALACGVQLRELPTAWCADFLFVAIDPAASLQAQLGGVAPMLEDISFQLAGRHDFNRAHYECDWQVAVENALEPDHIGFVHPQSLGKLDLQDGDNAFHGINSVWSAPLGSRSTARRLASISRFFGAQGAYQGYLSIYLFPFSMLSSTFGLSYSMQNFFPAAAPGSTHFTSRLYQTAVQPGAPDGVASTMFNASAAMNRQVFAEDAAVCRLVPAGTWTSEALPWPTAAEAKVEHFRASYRAQTAAQSVAQSVAHA